MEIPDEGELPPEATLIFHVSGSKVDPEGGPCERIDAGGLKCHEDGISVTCVDVFPGEGDEQLREAALALGAKMKIRKSGVIAAVRVGDLHAALEGEPAAVSVVRDKLPHNEGHCLIKGIQPADIGNLMLLAQAVSHFRSVKDFEGVINC